MAHRQLLRKVTTNFMVASRPKDAKLYNSEQLFENWRSCELVSAGFAVMSLIFATLEYELYYSDSRTHTNCAVKSDLDTFRFLMLMCSLVSLFFLVMRHYVKSIWKDYLSVMETSVLTASTFAHDINEPLTKKAPFLKPVLFIEALLLIIQPYPGLHIKINLPFKYQNTYMTTCYTLSELCYCVMFLRLILLVRAIANYTPYENYVARRYCHRYHVRPNMRFSFKCMMKMYPMPIVIFVIGIPCMIILGCIVRIFERPLIDLTNKEWDDPLNGIWFMFATMSTVGYGDYIPISYLGRTIAVFGYIVGGFIFALIMVSVQKEISLSENQTKAFTTVLLTDRAARTIQVAMKYNYKKNVLGEEHPSTKKKFRKLKNKIRLFKQKKEELDGLHTHNDHEFLQLKRSVKTIREELSEVYQKINLLAELATGRIQSGSRLNSRR